MSFSGMVKNELSRHLDRARHCNMAELSAILCGCARVEEIPGKPGRILRIHTENETVARKCFTLLQKTFNIETAVSVCDGFYQKRNRVYVIDLEDRDDAGTVLQGTKLVINGESGELFLQDDPLLIQRECCKRAFIRGAFLSSGSISDPNKGYHFEIVFSSEEKAVQLQNVIRGFGIDAKIVQRKRSYVVYVKEGAQIVDLLAIMGAGVSLMDLENIRILKEMRNTVNRKVNCETANINKTVSAAVKQTEDIRRIRDTIGFDSLSESLAEIAELRLAYPEATLKELGTMLNPQVGKSGVNHRLRKLGEIAAGLRENEEEVL